jgi:hypothetical protein
MFIDIQPGDIGFDNGGGIVGWIIRHGTGSAYSHCFVYHELLSTDKSGNQTWKTVEAWPSLKDGQDGIRIRLRTKSPSKVVRVWRTKNQQEKILEKSLSMVGTGYGWGEIFRISLRFIGIKIKGWESDKRAICSNHCTQSILFARPELKPFFNYPPSSIWPGELATSSDCIVWNQDRLQERKKR